MKNMKNLIKSILVTLLFSFASCGLLEKEIGVGCDDSINYHVDFKVTACVWNKGEIMAFGSLVDYTATKYYCDGDQHPTDGSVIIRESDGCGNGNYVPGFQLHNKGDYVIVTAWLSGRGPEKSTQTSKRYDWSDFTAKEREGYGQSKAFDVHFTFDDF